MPGPPQWFGENLADAVRKDDVDEKRVDDMVGRVLELIERTGRLDDTAQPDEECVDDPLDRAARAPSRARELRAPPERRAYCRSPA